MFFSLAWRAARGPPCRRFPTSAVANVPPRFLMCYVECLCKQPGSRKPWLPSHCSHMLSSSCILSAWTRKLPRLPAPHVQHVKPKFETVRMLLLYSELTFKFPSFQRQPQYTKSLNTFKLFFKVFLNTPFSLSCSQSSPNKMHSVLASSCHSHLNFTN